VCVGLYDISLIWLLDSNGATPTVGDVKFEVQTDVTYGGVSLTINKRGLSKRARGENLNECINTCSTETACVATSFTDSSSECSYFSKISGGSMSAPGTDFAQVTERAGKTIDASNPPTPGSPSTSGPSTNGTTPTGPSSTPVSSPSSGGSGSSGSSIGRPTFSSSLNYNSSSTASQSKTSSVQISGSSSAGSATGSASGSASLSATSASGSGSSAAPSATPSLKTVDGVIFSLEIDITYDGRILDLDLDLALSKRAGQTLDDCLSGCASTSACAGTAFDSDAGSCTYYSQVDKSTRKPAPGVTFATVVVPKQSSSSSGISSTVSSNSTATSSGSSASATPTGLEDLICPKLDGSVITNRLDVAFTIKCNHGVIGTPLTIDASRKRQATALPVSLSNCVDICSTETACVATTFDDATNQCAFFSTFDLIVAEGTDAALRLENNGAPVITVPVTVTETKTIQTEGGSVIQTGVVTRTVLETVCPTCAVTSVPAGAIGGNGGSYSTATVYATTVITISSCAPTVVSLQSLTNIYTKLTDFSLQTNCPLKNGQNAAVVTTVVPVSETVSLRFITNSRPSLADLLFSGLPLPICYKRSGCNCSLWCSHSEGCHH
jgi:hypothetical protein